MTQSEKLVLRPKSQTWSSVYYTEVGKFGKLGYLRAVILVVLVVFDFQSSRNSLMMRPLDRLYNDRRWPAFWMTHAASVYIPEVAFVCHESCTRRDRVLSTGLVVSSSIDLWRKPKFSTLEVAAQMVAAFGGVKFNWWKSSFQNAGCPCQKDWATPFISTTVIHC